MVASQTYKHGNGIASIMRPSAFGPAPKAQHALSHIEHKQREFARRNEDGLMAYNHPPHHHQQRTFGGSRPSTAGGFRGFQTGFSSPKQNRYHGLPGRTHSLRGRPRIITSPIEVLSHRRVDGFPEQPHGYWVITPSSKPTRYFSQNTRSVFRPQMRVKVHPSPTVSKMETCRSKPILEAAAVATPSRNAPDGWSRDPRKRLQINSKPVASRAPPQTYAIRSSNPHQIDPQIQRRNNTKKFVCPLCNKGLASKNNFLVHMRIHTREKPFKCPHCDKLFNHKSNLKSHEQVK